MLTSVLIVEDSEDDLYLAERSLKRSELFKEVHTASHGKEALNFLLRFTDESPPHGCFPPEVIFIDLKMPIMDGFELMEAFLPLSKHPSFQNTKIVVCTNSDSPDDRKRAVRFPFVKHFFRKPFSPVKVKEVAKALDLFPADTDQRFDR